MAIEDRPGGVPLGFDLAASLAACPALQMAAGFEDRESHSPLEFQLSWENELWSQVTRRQSAARLCTCSGVICKVLCLEVLCLSCFWGLTKLVWISGGGALCLLLPAPARPESLPASLGCRVLRPGGASALLGVAGAALAALSVGGGAALSLDTAALLRAGLPFLAAALLVSFMVLLARWVDDLVSRLGGVLLGLWTAACLWLGVLRGPPASFATASVPFSCMTALRYLDYW